MNRLCVLGMLAVVFCQSVVAQLTPEQHKKLVATARWLSKCRINYGERWQPPGDTSAFTMDCSNTVRYLYFKALHITLPRTASDQYYALHQQNLVTLAPTTPDGDVDTPALLAILRSGDLLFWEWTYNIKRSPPISHVMIYLGKIKDGTPKMTGSSSRLWGDRTRGGGIDVYTFDPNAPAGGVKNFWGDYIHRGKFVAFGRPLAQPSLAPDTKVSQKEPPTPAPEN